MKRSGLLLVLAAVLVVPIALLVPVLLPGPPSQAVLTSADREAIGDPGPERGADPLIPPVVPSSPAAVAVGYLRAAHSARSDDAGRTRRDAVAFAAPGSPAAAGVPVLDPPGPGEHRLAEVEAVEPAGSDPARGRSAFVADVRTATAAPGSAPRTARRQTRVVLQRGPDGRWAVIADTPITTDTPGPDD